MKVKFVTNCSTNNLKDIRLFVAKQIDGLNLDDKSKHQIVLAVDEAAANAIIHGNHCNEKKKINIELAANSKKLTIQISDIGQHPLLVSEHTNKNIHEIVKEKKKGGMGLKLMHTMMDEVKYFSKGKKNVCSLVKKLN